MNMATSRIQNSQAMHDWQRAVADLDAARSDNASEPAIDDLRVAVDLAAARVRSLSDYSPTARSKP